MIFLFIVVIFLLFHLLPYLVTLVLPTTSSYSFFLHHIIHLFFSFFQSAPSHNPITLYLLSLHLSPPLIHWQVLRTSHQQPYRRRCCPLSNLGPMLSDINQSCQVLARWVYALSTSLVLSGWSCFICDFVM